MMNMNTMPVKQRNHQGKLSKYIQSCNYPMSEIQFCGSARECLRVSAEKQYSEFMLDDKL